MTGGHAGDEQLDEEGDLIDEQLVRSMGPWWAAAWDHIDAAQEHRRQLVQCWDELRGGGGFGTFVTVRGPSGQIWVSIDWAHDTRERARAAAGGFVEEMFAALDATVTAGAELVAGAFDAGQALDLRMPLLLERAAFIEVISDGCFSSMRPEQKQLILQMQPFGATEDGVGSIMTFLVGLAEARDRRELDVASWAHSGRPEARVAVHGHEKVLAGGQMRSPLVAMESPRWWPREVLTSH